MTDKEIALELGKRLIAAKFRVAAMSGELDTYRDARWNHIPWRGNVDEILDGVLLPAAQERVEMLEHVLSEAKEEDLLRTLHTFLRELLTCGHSMPTAYQSQSSTQVCQVYSCHHILLT